MTIRTESQLLALIDQEGSNISLGKSTIDRQVLRDVVESIASIGGGGAAPGILDRSGLTVNLFNSSAEVIVHTFNIPAGTLPTDGDAIRAQFFGSISNNSGGNANHTYRVDIEGAGLAIATFDAQNPFVDNILSKFYTMDIRLQRTTAVAAHCWAKLTIGVAGGGGGDDQIATVLHAHDNFFTWDQTLARDFTLSMQMSVANVLTGFQLKGVLIESLVL